MMIARILCLLTLTALVAGCATDPATQQKYALAQMEYKLQVYGPACEKLGFEKDTNEWRTCIQRENEQAILRQQSFRDYSYPYRIPYYGNPYYLRR